MEGFNFFYMDKLDSIRLAILLTLDKEIRESYVFYTKKGRKEVFKVPGEYNISINIPLSYMNEIVEEIYDLFIEATTSFSYILDYIEQDESSYRLILNVVLTSIKGKNWNFLAPSTNYEISLTIVDMMCNREPNKLMLIHKQIYG